MKASNIILAVLVGSITLIITTGAMEIRFKGERRGEFKDEFQTTKVDLPEFHYLIIKDVRKRATLSFGGNQELEMFAKKGQEKPEINYYLKGDTLIFNLTNLDENKFEGFRINIPQGRLRWIQGQNTSFTIKDYQGELLALELDKTKVYFEGENRMEKLQVKGINESRIQSYKQDFDVLDLNLNNSEVDVHGVVNLLQGQMQNNSRLSVKEVIDFQFKKDRTSRLNHWE